MVLKQLGILATGWLPKVEWVAGPRLNMGAQLWEIIQLHYFGRPLLFLLFVVAGQPDLLAVLLLLQYLFLFGHLWTFMGVSMSANRRRTVFSSPFR